MIIRVYRKKQHDLIEPEVYCIVGTAPTVKTDCGVNSSLNKKVGSVTFSAAKGSFDPKCGEVQIYPKQDRTKICCGESK